MALRKAFAFSLSVSNIPIFRNERKLNKPSCVVLLPTLMTGANCNFKPFKRLPLHKTYPLPDNSEPKFPSLKSVSASPFYLP